MLSGVIGPGKALAPGARVWFSFVASPPAKGALKSSVSDPGSRAARYWAGFGAGAARTKLEGELVDAASGRVLLRFTQERRSGVGLGGGSYVNLLNRNLRAIGEDLGAGLQQF